MKQKISIKKSKPLNYKCILNVQLGEWGKIIKYATVNIKIILILMGKPTDFE